MVGRCRFLSMAKFLAGVIVGAGGLCVLLFGDLIVGRLFFAWLGGS